MAVANNDVDSARDRGEKIARDESANDCGNKDDEFDEADLRPKMKPRTMIVFRASGCQGLRV